MDAHSATSTGRVVSANVRALMALTRTSGEQVGVVLGGKNKSTVSRKLKSGAWSVDDIDALAAHWKVPVGRFFEDPHTLFGLDSGQFAWVSVVDPLQGVLDLAAA